MLIVRLISALVSNPLQRYYEEIWFCKFFLKKNQKNDLYKKNTSQKKQI